MRVSKILTVVERDLRTFLRWRALLAWRWIWFGVQITVFGLIMKRVVIAVPDYLPYYASGIAMMTLFSMAVMIGYDIYEEADDGINDYLLSLPLSRRELVIGRSIGGGLRAIILVFPIVLFILYLLKSFNMFSLIVSALAIFLFAMGSSGFSITLATSLRSSDKFDITMGIIDALILRLSTALYPLAFMPDFYKRVAISNPLSHVSDVFRWALGFDLEYLLTPGFSITVLIAFFVAFVGLGMLIYEKRLEGGAWR